MNSAAISWVVHPVVCLVKKKKKKKKKKGHFQRDRFLPSAEKVFVSSNIENKVNLYEMATVYWKFMLKKKKKKT